MSNFPGKRTTLREIHPGIEQYLAKCDDEIHGHMIYDTMFIYTSETAPCIVINSNKHMTAVVEHPDYDRAKAIMFWHDDKNIIDAKYADATANNIAYMSDFVNSGIVDSRKLDEFAYGKTKCSPESILKIIEGLGI